MVMLLLACAFITSDERDARRDRDGDGDPAVVFGGTDCDDTDPEINGFATETCNGVDDDCDGLSDNVDPELGVQGYPDSDGDGYGVTADGQTVCEILAGWSSEPGDCADGDPGIHPGADEVCNDLDDDCDGDVDDDDSDLAETTIYQDADGDGFGVSSTALEVRVCELPEGYADRDQDCDDTDPAINPDATEVCGGGDEDCDGLINDEDVIEAPNAWYADLDRDGYGDPETTFEACAPPLGYVANDQDCDDSLAAVRPGAPEYCDAADQDCDGLVDEAATDASVWYLDSDSDGWGTTDTVLASCKQPGGYVDQSGDCDDLEGSVYPGAVEECGGGVDANCDGSVDTDGDADGYLACEDCNDLDPYVNPSVTEICNGIDDDCDGDIDDADSSVDAGSQTAWYSDSDSDGYGDSTSVVFACNQPKANVGVGGDCDDTWDGANPGMLEVCNDAGDNDCDGTSTDCTHGRGKADASWTGVSSGDATGQSLWSADFDGDGNMDLAIGAPAGDEIFIVYGPSTGGSLAVADTFSAATSGDGPGSALHGGDTNADGIDDLLIGAADGSAVYVLLGPPSAGGPLSAADATLSTGSQLGASVRWINNDGNGYEDALMGDPEDGSGLGSQGGSVYLFAGPVTGGTLSTSGADASVTGGLGQNAGGLLAGLDSDGDGQDESAITGDGGSLSTSGSVWLFAPLSGALSLSDADVELSSGADLFSALAVNDVDGDGYEDLLVGDPERGGGHGAVFVVNGPITGDMPVSNGGGGISGGAGLGIGSSLAMVPDLDGDSIDEILIGGADGSNAWLVPGNLSPGVTLRITSADLTFSGSSGSLGTAVASGDVNGDGTADLIASDPDNNVNTGVILLLAGAELPY